MGYGQADQTDREMMALALQQARISLDAGGVPVVCVLPGGLRKANQAMAAAAAPRAKRFIQLPCSPSHR